MSHLPKKAGQIIQTTRVTVRQKTLESGGIHWTLFQVGKKRFMTHHMFTLGELVEAWPEKLMLSNQYRLIPDIHAVMEQTT